MKNVKVGFMGHGRSGCLWYRILNPMRALSKAGITTEWLEMDKDFVASEFQSVQFYGVHTFGVEALLKYLKEQHIKIVYDLDDALTLIEPTNQNYHPIKALRGSMQLFLDYADEVTTTTPVMVDYLKGFTNAPVTIVPNCFDPKEWTFPRPQRGGIRIGFSGSVTHIPDLLLVIPSIRELQKKYDIRFLIQGFGGEDYQEWYKQTKYKASEELLPLLEELDKELSTIKFEWVPYVDYNLYPNILQNMSLDIGLCPLLDSPFNRCKSAIKAMEYTLSGALALASDVIPYTEEPTSIKGDWREKIEWFINNREEAEAYLQYHLNWIKDERNINHKLDLLRSVYVG